LEELVIVRLGPYPRDVIVGLVLSDGWLIIVSKGSNNARLELFSLQLIIYLYFFLCLSHCCSSYPSWTRFEKQNISLQFFTIALPYFTEMYYLFYPNKV